MNEINCIKKDQSLIDEMRLKIFFDVGITGED